MAKGKTPAAAAPVTHAAQEQLAGVTNPFARQIDQLLAAGFQAALVPTSEYMRVEMILRALASKLTRANAEKAKNDKSKRSAQIESDPYSAFDIVHWSVAEGFSLVRLDGDGSDPNAFSYVQWPIADQAKTLGRMPTDATAALALIPELRKMGVAYNAFVIMHDFHVQLANQAATRALLQAMTARNNFHSQMLLRFLVFQQNSIFWPAECEHCVRRVELPFPDDAGMTWTMDALEQSMAADVRLSPEMRTPVIRGLRGLGAQAAEDVLSLAYVERLQVEEDENADERTLSIVERYKADAIRTEGLTYVPREQISDISDICGYDAFIDTMRRGALAYRDDAKRAKIDTPRGFVLIGVPGSGKSQIAYAAAKELDMPLVMFDPSQMLGSLVGQTEHRVRDALRTIEAQRGCVVVIDELDKMLVTSNGSSDGGVSMRMFGMILRWLQERKDESIVIVTLNRTAGIDPELFRSGRFDGVFGVGLPDERTRKQILEVHFAKRGVVELFLEPHEWDTLIQDTDGLLGSDMEEIVKQSRAAALQRLVDSDQEIKSIILPSFAELRKAASDVRDQSITKLESERVRAVCQFVEQNCRPVNYPAGRSSAVRQRRALHTAADEG